MGWGGEGRSRTIFFRKWVVAIDSLVFFCLFWSGFRQTAPHPYPHYWVCLGGGGVHLLSFPYLQAQVNFDGVPGTVFALHMYQYSDADWPPREFAHAPPAQRAGMFSDGLWSCSMTNPWLNGALLLENAVHGPPAG